MSLAMPMNILYNFNYFSDFGSSMLRFKDAKELLEAKDHRKMSSIVSTISCLVALVETDHDDEVTSLIDMVNEIKVDRRYLLLIVSTLNTTILKNKTITYNVGIHEKDKGAKYEFFVT